MVSTESPARSAEPPVTALAFDPAGTQVVAGSQAGVVVRAWPGLEVVRTLPTELVNVHAITFSPDGKRLAVGGGSPAESGAVEVHAWPEGRLLVRVAPHEDVVYGLAWSPNGERLATASLDRSTALLAATDGEVLRRLNGHSRGVTAVAFLGAERLVTASLDQSLRLWNIGDDEPVRSFDNHTRDVHAIAVRPGLDEDAPPMVATAGADRTVRLWQPTIGRLVRFARLSSEPRDVAWTADGARLVVACLDGSVRVIDPDTVEVLREIPAIDGPAYALAVSEQGVAVGGANGAVRRVVIDEVDERE